jgi:hypothetical protein
MKQSKSFAGSEEGKRAGGCMKLKQVLVLLALLGIIFSLGCIAPESEQGITEADSREIARAFVENSPTYQFDGFDLAYNQTVVLRCPYCWMFVFEFTSRHAGYGDRTGQVLAQVITPHTASVTVVQGNVTSATLDGTWDMLKQMPVRDYVPPAEAQAQEIAKDYVMNMDEYKNYTGRNLRITEVIQAQCPGCWQIELEFYRASEKDPSRTDRATVTITLDNWEVVDVLYAAGRHAF